MSFLACALMLGCTSTNNTLPVANSSVEDDSAQNASVRHIHQRTLAHLFEQPILQPADIAINDIFELSASQIEDFKAYFFAEHRKDQKPHLRFYDYLETKLSFFSYRGATLPAGQALAQQSGNCLSLAILTTALAKLANLEVTYQKVDSRPIFSKHEGILLLSSHVRTKVYAPKTENPNEIVFARAHINIDYFPTSGDVSGSTVACNDFLAMYYQNMAAESMLENQYNAAFAYIQRGIKQSPNNPESLNLLAVLYKRTGQLALAKEVFEFMQANKLYSLNAIENHANLLKQLNQPKQAELLFQRLDGVNDSNPYRWLSVAEQHYELGEYRLALKYSNKASEIAPYLHEPHFLMAKVFQKQLKTGASLRAIRRAGELAEESDDRMRYLAKLKVLKSES